MNRSIDSMECGKWHSWTS